MTALSQVCACNLSDCWVSAGFVRNMVWDHLHGNPSSRLNDIDVIYFDPLDVNSEAGMQAEIHLSKQLPEQNWQVRNQAVMHIRNGHSPYSSSSDAMTFWPEIETAIAARLLRSGVIEICAPFGVESLLQGLITPNAKAPSGAFEERVHKKEWLLKWPKLKIATRQGDAPEPATKANSASRPPTAPARLIRDVR